MRNRSFILFGLLYIVLLTNCSNPPEFKTKNYTNILSEIDYSLEVIDTVSIPIDSLTSDKNPTFQYKEIDSQPYFTLYNPIAHQIQFYNLSTLLNEYNISLSSEGPNGISVLMGYYVHNLDSLFLLPYNGNSIFLLDATGSVKKTYDLHSPIKQNNIIYEPSLNGYFDIGYDNQTKKIKFAGSPYVDRETSKYYELPQVMEFDLNQNDIELYGSFPDSYQKNDLYYLLEEIHRVEADTHEILHFSASHDIMLYHIKENKRLKTITAKSNYLPNKILPLLQDGDDATQLQKQRNYLITEGFYTRIVYDNKNKLLYRFVRHPQELKDHTGLLNTTIKRPRSVIIIDSIFQVAGEFKLPSSYFIDQVSFVSDGYLWINIDHPEDSVTNNENFLQFVRFKPIKKDE